MTPIQTITELEKQSELLQHKKSILKKKKENFKQIPQEEIVYLLDSKKVITHNPLFIEGRMRKYLNEFQKPFKLNRTEFLDLLEKAEIQAENQSKEKEIFGESVEVQT